MATKPNYGRKKPKRQSALDEELEAVLAEALTQAASYVDTEQAPFRKQALEYYKGEPFGNEEDGRSQIVMTELRDTVLAMLPSLMRVFLSQEDVAWFKPNRPEEADQADQATDYINHILRADNDAFTLIYSALKDGLRSRIGIIKWWIDNRVTVTEETYTGLNQLQIVLLQGDESVTILSVRRQSSKEIASGIEDDGADDYNESASEDATEGYEPPPVAPPASPSLNGAAAVPNGLGSSTPQPAPMAGPGGPQPPPGPAAGPFGPQMPGPQMPGPGGPPPMPGQAPGGPPAGPAPAGPMPDDLTQLYEVKLRRTLKDQKFRVEAVPPEELLVAREARQPKDCVILSHRKFELLSDLVAMGYDEDEILEFGGPVSSGDTFEFNQEAQARVPSLWTQQDDFGHEPLRRFQYNETLLRFDYDGDGIAELRRICSVGNGHILHNEYAEDINFAFWCCDPEPHAFFGQSVADQTMDLQLIKSSIMRNTLDSLALAVHPRTWAVEGQVNMDDVLNVETGAIIRCRQPGMLGEFDTTFTGSQAMPLLQYLDDIKASRTGVSRATQGLDPDVLQSTTKAAVLATTAAAEQRIELVARAFAETGLRQLMKGLLRAVIRHQDKPRMVRLRGKWVEVDPRSWNAEMDVEIEVGIGLGQQQDRISFYMGIAQKQEQIIATYGADNCLCSLLEYRNTLARLHQVMGERDVTRFWKQPTQQDMQQMTQAAAQAAQEAKQMQAQQNAGKGGNPQHDMALVQVEQTKAATQANESNNRLQIERNKAFNESQKIQLDAKDKTAHAQIELGRLQLQHRQLQLEERKQAHAEIEAERAHQRALAGVLLPKPTSHLDERKQAHVERVSGEQHAREAAKIHIAAHTAETKANQPPKGST